MKFKSVIYLAIISFVLASCSTSNKVAKTPKVLLSPPEGITFTQITNFDQFASIQMPYEGKGFRKNNNSGGKNDAGETVPGLLHEGTHIYLYGDVSKLRSSKNMSVSDLNASLEAVKKMHIMRVFLKKENIKEEYSDVIISGITCKKIDIIRPLGDGSYTTFMLGYIVPHHETTALFILDNGYTETSKFKENYQTVDSAFRYMISTTQFREI